MLCVGLVSFGRSVFGVTALGLKDSLGAMGISSALPFGMFPSVSSSDLFKKVQSLAAQLGWKGAFP